MGILRPRHPVPQQRQVTRALIHTATATIKGTSETILTNAQGMTLYYRTSDTATSVCSGGCASAWPPLLVTGSSTYQFSISTWKSESLVVPMRMVPSVRIMGTRCIPLQAIQHRVKTEWRSCRGRLVCGANEPEVVTATCCRFLKRN